MKRYTAILLVFSLLVQALGSISVLTCYKLNKALITEYFCVNKAKPALRCEGNAI